jgi:hypothetical protein
VRPLPLPSRALVQPSIQPPRVPDEIGRRTRYARRARKLLSRYTGDRLDDDVYIDMLAELKFPTEKPPAFVGLDDRVIQFQGEWPSINMLKNFKPWNAKEV